MTQPNHPTRPDHPRMEHRLPQAPNEPACIRQAIRKRSPAIRISMLR